MKSEFLKVPVSFPIIYRIEHTLRSTIIYRIHYTIIHYISNTLYNYTLYIEYIIRFYIYDYIQNIYRTWTYFKFKYVLTEKEFKKSLLKIRDI